jgi:aspartyl-tRNA synthetase
MNRTNNIETINLVGQEVLIKGWVNVRRNMGKIVFLDMRDRSGVVQVVIVPKMVTEDSQKILDEIRNEFLLEIVGTVQKKDKVNPNLPTGEVEILAKSISVISKCEVLPFPVDADSQAVVESIRLKNRYLDLRTERLKNNLYTRHIVNHFLRNKFTDMGFWEIETPCLTKGTPEGSREYIVPSRIHAGEFYVLPQSPQQFKQLLMVSGIEKYFQVARCFRDEDQRGDRQPEFTQFDLEMSFASQEDIIQAVEQALIELVEKHFPNHRIQTKPFPRITYKESMEKYGNDKPDMREDKNDDKLLAFCWVVDFPMFEIGEADKKIGAVHHPFTRPLDEDLALIDKEPLKARANAYDIVLNGFEIGGGSLRIFERELQNKVFQILGLTEEEIQSRFGHMLEAFTFSPPPHGGLALGLDRLICLLCGEKNIREVIAFPKTGDAKDLMMGAPSPLPEGTLDEMHIQIKKKKK